MQLFPTLAAALAASTTSVSASATAPATTCAAPTATVTEIVQHVNCRRLVCIKPTRFCSAGEPTRPEAHPPIVLTTITPTGACTAVAEAIANPGCNLCPTCVAAPVPDPTCAVAEPTHTAALATSIFTA